LNFGIGIRDTVQNVEQQRGLYNFKKNRPICIIIYSLIIIIYRNYHIVGGKTRVDLRIAQFDSGNRVWGIRDIIYC